MSVQIVEKNAGTITNACPDDGINLLRAIFWGASGELYNTHVPVSRPPGLHSSAE